MVEGGIYGCGQRAPWREAESIKGWEWEIIEGRREDGKKERKKEKKGRRKKEGEKTRYDDTNPTASACVLVECPVK